jgi:hypothetical protein
VGASKRTRGQQASQPPAATATLVVRARAAGGDPVEPADLMGLPALPGGQVVVDGPDGRTAELRDGQARFEGLSAGNHSVELRPAEGFAAPARLHVLDEQGRPFPADGPIAVGPGEERTVVAACPRTHVRLTGTIELPTAHRGRTKRPEFPIALEVRHAGERLTTITADKGSFDERVEAAGPVEVVAHPLKDRAGRRLVPEQPRATAEPDGGPVTLKYHHAGAIRVAAFVEDDSGTRKAPGVHFTLRTIAEPDEVLHDRTTSTRQPVVKFEDLLPGVYVVVADPETVAGHPPLQLVRPPDGRMQVEVEAGDTADLTDDFEFEREPATVTGDVRDAADGAGLRGVRVELHDPAGEEPPRRIATNQDGRYVFGDVEPGLWRVLPARPVFDAVGRQWRPRPPDAGERQVAPGPGETVEAEDILLDLAPGSVRGRVLGTDGNGIAGVEVALEPADGGGVRRTRLSDADGWFLFTPVDPGGFILRLVDPVQVGDGLFEPVAGTGDRRAVTVASGRLTVVPAFELELVQEVGTVSGRLRDADGNGLPGLPVQLFEDGKGPQVVDTDVRGIFTFTLVTPGVQLVSVGGVVAAGGINWRPVPPDSGQRSVDVEAGDTIQVPDIVLERVADPGTITGFVRVDEDGSGLPGVTLEVRPAAGGAPLTSIFTDAEGAFSVQVPAGTWAIEPDELPIQAADRLWTPKPPDDPGTRVVQVTAGARSVAAPLVVEPVVVPIQIGGQVGDATVRPVPGQPVTGLAGVRLRLRLAGGGGERFTVTNAQGNFAFANVKPGGYVVELEQIPFQLAGQDWEPVDGDSGARPVTVEKTSVNVEPLLVQPERHLIFGKVTRPDGSPAAFLPVRVLDDQNQELVAVQTDIDGNYEAEVAREGRFIIEFLQDGRGIRRTVTVASQNQLNLTIGDDAGGGGAAPPATQDFAAFPVLTEEVSAAQLPTAGAPPSAVGQTVEAALREALGWRPRPNDPRSFSAALVQSFDRHEVEGHTESTWTPRTYAAQVTADLGAITGAQASVYSRARVALDAALPLLDGLYPLDPAADPQDTEAIRSIIRSELNELVTELGVEGGPRISRVDDLLELLLRNPVATSVPTTVLGHLGQLEDRFGLSSARVQSIEEEEDLTNFLILVDYVREIDTSWQARRTSFDPTSNAIPFLGTQLVLLSRSLAVTAESVAEVGFTLDSVFLGAAERLAIRLTFPATDLTTGTSTLTDSRGDPLVVPGSTPSILLGELLSWVERVAAEEGPRLLQDGGKDGASALTPVLDRLRALVRASLVDTGSGPNKGLQPPDSLPTGYATARVQRALSELAKYLDDSADLARRIQR